MDIFHARYELDVLFMALRPGCFFLLLLSSSILSVLRVSTRRIYLFLDKMIPHDSACSSAHDLPLPFIVDDEADV